jgi:hypothetical protein
LRNAELTELGELEQRKKCGKNLPGLGILANDVSPSCSCAHCKDCAHGCDCSVDIERTGNDVMNRWFFRNAKNAIDRREQFGTRQRKRRSGRRGGRKILRQVRSRKTVSAVITAPLEHIDNLTHLLVFEKSSHELGTRILPRLIAFAAREEHLRLDANESRSHLEVVRSFIESQCLYPFQKLLSYACNRNILNVDLLIADE